MLNDALIRAYKAELEGYLRRGLTDRAEAVVAQLVALGCEEFLSTKLSSALSPEGGATPKKKTAARKAPKK
jgi:hypothetical protein